GGVADGAGGWQATVAGGGVPARGQGQGGLPGDGHRRGPVELLLPVPAAAAGAGGGVGSARTSARRRGRADVRPCHVLDPDLRRRQTADRPPVQRVEHDGPSWTAGGGR